MELEQEGSREVVSIPATSFRSRNSNSARYLRVVEPRLSSESSARAADLQATEHKVVVGATEDGAVNLLDDVDHSKQIYVCFDHVNAFVPNMVPGGGQYSQLLALPKAFLSWRPKLPYRSGKDADQKAVTDANREEAGHRQILYKVSGCCRPGEVLAFMGPSGSGKTTLLSIIGQRAQKIMKRSGDITFNGGPLTKTFKRQLGYVMQDDLLYESLTVEETLYYAAMLRLPRHLSREDKKTRVSTVIKALGIESCKDTIIGGFFRKGISGGERKRASIGHELLINPSLILLDEPTSGLDSTTAMHLLHLLRQLAQGGRAVITTIHQPSSRLFQQLDKLLLLSKGHSLYYGRASVCDQWFACLGYKLPYKINVADFILDIASNDVSTETRDGEASRQYLIGCSEAFLKRHPLDGFDSQADASQVKETTLLRDSAPAHRGQDADLASNSSASSIEPGTLAHDLEMGMVSKETPAEQAAGSQWGASYPTQFSVLFTRSIRTRRFQTLSTQDLCLFLVVGVLAGLFYLQRARHDTLSAASDTIGLLFFELLFLSFRSLFLALFTFPEEFKMLLKERASGMYQLSAFFFARTLSDLPLDICLPLVLLVIVYFMAGLRYTAGAFFANLFSVYLVMLVAQSYGLLLGTLLMNPKTAQTIAAVFMLVYVLVAGFFVRGVKVWISWIKYISFVFYGYGLLQHIEFGGRQLYACSLPQTSAVSSALSAVDAPNPATNPICTPVTSIQQSLGLLQDPNSKVWLVLNPCILIFMLVLLRVLTFYALKWKTSPLKS